MTTSKSHMDTQITHDRSKIKDHRSPKWSYVLLDLTSLTSDFSRSSPSFGLNEMNTSLLYLKPKTSPLSLSVELHLMLFLWLCLLIVNGLNHYSFINYSRRGRKWNENDFKLQSESGKVRKFYYIYKKDRIKLQNPDNSQ